MKKKAQSISINTIIVAAIALVVMVLVVMIFTQNITKFRNSSGRCESNGGTCVKVETADKPVLNQYENCAGVYDKPRSDYVCNENYICCLKA
jgi:hypothetical protein